MKEDGLVLLAKDCITVILKEVNYGKLQNQGMRITDFP
jgi:hypothetical protein